MLKKVDRLIGCAVGSIVSISVATIILHIDNTQKLLNALDKEILSRQDQLAQESIKQPIKDSAADCIERFPTGTSFTLVKNANGSWFCLNNN